MPIALKRWHLPAIGVAVAGGFLAMSMSATGKPTAQQVAASLESSVDADSHSWFMNRYDEGSLKGLQLVRQENLHSLIVKAAYTYNSGKEGWVMARVIDGHIQCLQYWDKNFCKPVGTYASQGQPTGHTRYEPQQSDNTLGECVFNHGFVGQMCKDAGIGVEADNPEEHQESSPPEQQPEPEPPSDNNAGGDGD